jgi:hypothetical protein
MKYKIYKEFVHFYKFIFIKEWLKNSFLIYWNNTSIFHNKFLKKSFMWKNYFREKRHVVLIKVMLVTPLNAFWPMGT